ncbi:MAG: DNA-3-methyladenine glycosylase [Verrucomicrobia bacterium]|nr:DNA-3-methyladenine glycosylase [Verrucomicrobiota bacterium]
MNLRIKREFFETDPLTCAEALIGCELRWGKLAGRIVETEAYAEYGDQASHTFLRRGTRRFIEVHPAGSLYVYLNYGVHWLMNFLVKGGTANGFVLIRALEPTQGLDLMAVRRGVHDPSSFCSGPGKLTQALAIDGSFHGRDFFQMDQAWLLSSPKGVKVDRDYRIGITKSAELQWRFLCSGSAHLSVRIGAKSRNGKTRPRITG